MPDVQVPPPPIGGGGGPIYEPVADTSEVAKTISVQSINPQLPEPVPIPPPQILGYPDPNYQLRTIVGIYGNTLF